MSCDCAGNWQTQALTSPGRPQFPSSIRAQKSATDSKRISSSRAILFLEIKAAIRADGPFGGHHAIDQHRCFPSTAPMSGRQQTLLCELCVSANFDINIPETVSVCPGRKLGFNTEFAGVRRIPREYLPAISAHHCELCVELWACFPDRLLAPPDLAHPGVRVTLPLPVSSIAPSR